MKVAVYSKTNLKDNEVKQSLSSKLSALGHDIVELDDLTDNSTDFDRLLVFGGDGTMLYASTRAKCPILGVNLGNVGFLTHYESNVMAEDLSNALESSNFQCRNLLETTVGNVTQYALNDFVVRTTSCRPIFLSVKINGVFAHKYHADGIIVSSPTGSTAYSLSAGGPIVAPDVDAIIINPICAHSLNSRPIIVSGNSKIEIEVESIDALMIADGREQIKLEKIDKIEILKSSKTAKFIGVNTNFYNKLYEKMNKWGFTD